MQRRREEGLPLRGKFMGEQGKEAGGSTANPHRGLAIVVVLLVAVAVVIPTVVVPKVRERANSRAIALACNATRYPETCTAALAANSASLTSSPQGLAAVAAAAAADAVSASLANATAYRIHPEVVLNATFNGLVVDCLHTLALAHEQLQISQTTLENLEPEFDTLRTSLSAALTFTGTCADGLKRIPTPAGTSLRLRANLTFQIVSNALAITNTLAAHGDNLQNWTPTYFLANLRTANPRCANPPSPSRRRTLESTPTWLRPHDRRILSSPDDPSPDVTVALDGSGNYTSIQAAVDAAPINLPSRYVIYIKPGLYNEIIRVSSQHKHLMFLGAGINQTIITNNRSASLTGTTTFQSATVGVAGEGFMAKGVTFRNTAGAIGEQAVALRVSADRSVVYECAVEGFQDTLWAHAFRQFYRNCVVSGTVDFVFGNAAAVLQRCTLLARANLPGKQNVVTAQGRPDPGQCTGFVLHNCTLGAAPDLNPASQITYLGRPWKQFSLVLILHSSISSTIHPSGWLPFTGDFALETLFYGEYGNSGPGASTGARVNWSTVITDPDVVKALEVESFLGAASWLPSAGVSYSEYSL